jgi:ribosomal protein L37E
MNVLESLRELLDGDEVVLYECRRCGATVSAEAVECGRCGSPEIARYEW